jgi:hypothetical protein
MPKRLDDGRVIIPTGLARILRLWLWMAAPLFAAGFVIFWIGFALGIKWLWFSGTVLCGPIVLFYFFALGVFIVTIIGAPVRDSNTKAKSITFTSQPRGVWDREMDG